MHRFFGMAVVDCRSLTTVGGGGASSERARQSNDKDPYTFWTEMEPCLFQDFSI